MKNIEQKYIKKIISDCRTGDEEINGCNLDKIMSEFLKEINMNKLESVFSDVDAWRS